MLLVTGVLAVTMDPLRRLLKDAAIAIKGEKIINIGKAAELEARFPNAERLDGRGMLALPGFIDTHVHSDQALLRSFADETTWRPFLFDYIFPLLRYRTTKDALVSLQLCILEMLKAGTTCFVDTMIHSRYEFDVLASAVAEMGLRGVLAKYVMPQAAFENNKIDTRTFHSEDESFASAERAIEHWNHVNNGRAQVWLGPLVPRDPETCTPSFYMRVAHVAAKTKTGAVLHLGAEQDDLKFFDESFHMRPVEFAWAYGLVGQNILLIGSCWLSNDEVQILVRTKTNVVHSPSANMKMASGVAPVAKLRGAGVNVTLGTDAGANNNAHDMIREMKAACLLQSISTMDPSALAAEDALEMATIDAARAIGREDELGSLEEGKLADLILIDLKQPHTTPVHDAVSNLVYAAHGGNVDTVIVGGRVLMRHRQALYINESAILKQAQTYGEGLLQRAGVKVAPRWSIE